MHAYVCTNTCILACRRVPVVAGAQGSGTRSVERPYHPWMQGAARLSAAARRKKTQPKTHRGSKMSRARKEKILRQKKKQKLKRKKKTFSRPRRRQSPFAHPLEIANIRDPRLVPTLCTAPDVIEKAGQLFYWCSIDKRSTVPQTGSAGKRTKLRFPHKHRACK